jgi:hypothetical protein
MSRNGRIERPRSRRALGDRPPFRYRWLASQIVWT